MTFYSWVGSTARKWFGSLYVLQFNTNFSHPFCWKSLSPIQCAVKVGGFTSKGLQLAAQSDCFRISQECGYDNRISLWNHHQAFEETQIVAASWLHCTLPRSPIYLGWFWNPFLVVVFQPSANQSFGSSPLCEIQQKKTTNLGTTTNSI